MQIPIHHDSLYYLYNCANKEIQPCSKQEYNTCLDYLQLEGENNSSEKKDVNDLSFAADNKFEKFQYSDVTKEMALRSLSNVDHITLELTEKCNMQCVYCCYGKLYKDERSHVVSSKNSIVNNLRTLLDLRRNSNNLSDLRISFYGGEPLLYFDVIKECVELSRNILPDVNLSFGMTTNGLLLKKYIDFLVANKFSILISLDGNRRNNEYRILKDGTASFNQVVNNVEYIFKKHPDYFINCVNFSTVLHNKSNILEALDFFSHWKKIPHFSLVTTSNAQNKDAFFNALTERKEYSKDELAIIEKNYPDVFSSFHLNKSLIISKWQNDGIENCSPVFEDKRLYPGKSCFLFSNRVFVTLDGTLYPCEKISRKFKFGKLKEGVITIYKKRINNYYSSIQKLFDKNCLKCYKRYSCSSCFFAEEEDIKNRICFCDHSKAIEGIKKQIENNK